MNTRQELYFLPPEKAFFQGALYECQEIEILTPTSEIWENDGILFRVLEGGGEIEINGYRERLVPGCYGMLLPYHICRFLPETRLVLSAMKVDLLLLFYSGGKMDGVQPSGRSVLRCPTEEQSEALGQIWEECAREQGVRVGIAAAMAHRLIRRLAFCVPSKEKAEYPLAFLMMEDLANHLKQDLSAEACAARLGCSAEALREEAQRLTECSWEDLTDHLRAVFMGQWVYNEEITFEGKLEELHYSSSTRFYHCFYSAWKIRYPAFAEWLFSRRYQNEYFDKDQRAYELLSFLQLHMLEETEKMKKAVQERFGMTARYADRLLRYKFGRSISAFLKKWRIQYAADLLVTTDRTLESISEECGFGSVQTLKRLFRRRFHKNPMDFRNENRKEYPQ